MKLELETKDVLEIEFKEFQLFYTLFNSGEKVLWFKEKEDRFLLLTFIDAPILCTVLKDDIIAEANPPDLYPETINKIVVGWREQWLQGQAPNQLAKPFIRFGGIE